uniref:Uncharacterized protein n=1 Tax=Nelumbo nucifera TaxID=4432 RepID=A0A822ZGR7_NELNU|nr:TPA_asm: hypothetical protein HUJ06_000456 [Nelumbo nucifera]
MGRGRGKGKKSTVVANHEDPGSGGEESLPAYKRRGRPQKPLKDEIDEEVEKIEEEDGENTKPAATSKEVKSQAAAENGKKRKRYSQNGNRRKSKPRRAAEAGVECK